MNEKIQILIQLISAISEAIEKLEYAYNDRDIEKFEEIKKEILLMHNKINETLT